MTAKLFAGIATVFCANRYKSERNIKEHDIELLKRHTAREQRGRTKRPAPNLEESC